MSKTISGILASCVEGCLAFTGKRNRNRSIAMMADILQKRGIEQFQVGDKTIKLMTRFGPFLSTMVKNFRQDEPETLEWIDRFVEPSSHFWDIGSNIGLYTLYAGIKDAKVSSFEPSALNYSVLNQQIHLNDLCNTVQAYCLGFSEKTGLDCLCIKDLHAGNVFNTVGESANQFGQYDSVFDQGILSFTVDDFISFSGLEVPNHVKLDVDGIEAKILKGASQTFSQIKSLMIEIEGEETRQKELLDLITTFGLVDKTNILNTASKRNRLFVRR